MNSQADIWLYSLVFMSAFALVLYVRMGLHWTWGFCLQALFMLLLGLAGFVLSPLAPLFALTGWGFFGLVMVLPRFLLGRLERHLTLLAPEQALAYARLLQLFFWGAPGRFWTDIARAMQFYVQRQGEMAEALLDAWNDFPVPPGTRAALDNYKLTGRVVMRDWQGILEEFNHIQARQGGFATAAAVAASRAAMELGRYQEAVSLLGLSDLRLARLSHESLSMAFIPFFSLAGAEDSLEDLLAGLENAKKDLPECARLYWQGRCRAAAGKPYEAAATLEKALEATPEALDAWKERIVHQLHRVREEGKALAAPDLTAEIARARQSLDRARAVAEIVSPRKRCWAVTSLVMLILASYAVSHSYTIYKTPYTLMVSLECFRWGVLDSASVLAGEYWRLVSYLFLHSHMSHLALNLIGLWWFGRLAENLYGTWRFIIIYFFCGIVSGLAHVLLSPEMMAVGASGAVMGVFGAATAGIFRSKKVLPESVRRTEVSWMLGLAAAQVILDQVIPHVAVFAHLGGLVAGLVIGLLMPMGKRRFEPARRVAAGSTT